VYSRRNHLKGVNNVSTPRGGVNRCTANLMNKMRKLKLKMQHT